MVKNNYKFLFLSLLLSSVNVCATDFGEAQLRSNLGEAFKAKVALHGVAPTLMVASCFRSKIETIDGILLAKPRIEFDGYSSATNVAQLKFSTREVISEPAVTFTLELICDGHMQRVYPLLLDYPEMAAPASGEALADAMENEVVQPVRTSSSGSKAVRPRPVVGKQVVPDERPARKPAELASQPASSKLSRDLNLTRDSLKISNEEISMPVAAAAAAQSPEALEKQRLAENKAAEEGFAKMMRGEPSLNSTQEELKKEQQRSLKLEHELLSLKTDIQFKNQQQSVPSLLIVLNGIILLLLVGAVTVLTVKLKRARRAEKQNWSDESYEWQTPQPAEETMSAQQIEVPLKMPEDNRNAQQEQALNSYLSSMGLDPNLVSESATVPVKEKTTAAPYTFNLFANRENQSIQIEEISDAMQEAEFWLSIKDPKRAIEILEPHCMDENPATPVMWLLLLDLYRMVADRERYNQLRMRLKQKFNSNILEFGETSSPDTIKFLCDYEHLTNKLTAFWNTNYILPYLESLLIDDREGERVGFELSVYQDILMLIAICKELEKPEVMINIALEQ